MSTLDQLPADIIRPTYDRSTVRVGIVHFGVGGFHRSHQAMYLDRLLTLGGSKDWGICGVGLLHSDQKHLNQLRAQDHLYTLVVKDPHGPNEVRVIGSIIDSLFGPDNPQSVLDVLSNPGTRIVSLTITEGGYNVDQVTGEFDVSNPDVRADIADPATPTTVFGYVVEALARRRMRGVAPFAVMSCDNIQSNGRVARHAFSSFAQLRDPELAEWIRWSVPFPNSMVDRITPATTSRDVADVQQYGIADGWPVVCEPFTQWVLEDDFPLGRPEWNQVGVQMTDDVEPYELMKLRLLNAGHQALAYSGHLAGYTYVHDAAADPVFAEFLRGYMHREGKPTLLPVQGIDVNDYIETLLDRFTNPELGDTIARLAAWGSDRIPKWLVPVVERNLESGGPIAHSATVIASWARYAEGVDEQGAPFEVVDSAAREVQTAARSYPVDALAFIRNRRFFGDLASSRRFAQEYLHALESLHSVGSRATVIDVNAATDNAGQ